jgi:hypothetical protein
MIILTTSSSSQQLKVIPRTFANNFTFRLRDNSTNTVKDYEVTAATTSGNYLVVNQAFSPVLVENRFYDLEFISDPNFWNTNYFLWNAYEQLWNVDTTEIIDIYKDRIFVTNQEINQLDDKYYDINKDQYTTNNSYNNEYIVV